MEAELVVGAVLGALLGELLKGLINLLEKAIHFKPELQEIKAQVEFLISLMKQVDELGDNFQLQYSITLKQLIHKGIRLILECDNAVEHRFLKFHKISSYTKKLRKLDAEFQRASLNFLLQLNVQHMKKLQALQNNNNNRHVGARFLVGKIIKKIFTNESNNNNDCCSCGLRSDIPNYPTTKLPLMFYHSRRLKGKTGANFVDALVGRAVEHIKEDQKEGVEGRIEEWIKKWGEVRFEMIFHRTFESSIEGEERVVNWFACDLSIMKEAEDGPCFTNGILFLSTAKLAFCSLKHKSLYLKVVIPFQLVKIIDFDEEEKKIQVISVDDQEFGFIKFRNYNDAKKCIQDIPVTPPTSTLCTHSPSLP